MDEGGGKERENVEMEGVVSESERRNEKVKLDRII